MKLKELVEIIDKYVKIDFWTGEYYVLTVKNKERLAKDIQKMIYKEKNSHEIST